MSPRRFVAAALRCRLAFSSQGRRTAAPYLGIITASCLLLCDARFLLALSDFREGKRAVSFS